MTSHSDKIPLIHGLIDGELDAANSIAIEKHLRECAECQEELERIQAVRDLLAAAPLKSAASDDLRNRIETMLSREAGNSVRRPRPAAPTSAPPPGLAIAGRGIAAHVLSGRWASGALAGMVAACLLIAVAMPQLTYTGTEDQLVQSHVRSLQVGHLVDVPTSDRHVVKPWFNGKIDFAPPVPELADQGFPLVGGRLDYLDDHEVAAIVYHRRLHAINLFVRPANGLSLPTAFRSHREGYNLIRWTSGGLEFWAVSDVDAADLAAFEDAYRSRT